MKIALATTTIHVPHALKLMRKCSEDVRFFVALDEKSAEIPVEMDTELPDYCLWMPPVSQKKWKCSEAIGWNTLARRNLAFLEALEWGADVIYSWDNDNIPTSPYHFVPFDGPWLFDGIKVTGDWFDPGQLLIPATRHRGFPHGKPVSKQASHVVDAKVGVAAGLVIGAGDADATTQIEHKPDIGQVHILGSTGVVVDNHTWTVWNSQNTAVLRELIPAWFMAPGCQRHDDIFASLVVQRVMRERGYHVHFGPPFTFHERNKHDLLVDLRAEIDGMRNVERMACLLDNIVLVGRNVIDDTRVIYAQLSHVDWYPKEAVIAAFAWLEDCEGLGL